MTCHWFLTIGGEEEVCCILLWQPSDFVDFLFDLQTLQVVKVWLVTLERAVDIVLPGVPRLPRLLRLPFRLSGANSETNTALNEGLRVEKLVERTSRYDAQSAVVFVEILGIEWGI